MRKNKWKIVSVLLITLSLISIQLNTYTHSGRTDANGGHRDNKNKSGFSRKILVSLLRIYKFYDIKKKEFNKKRKEEII